MKSMSLVIKSMTICVLILVIFLVGCSSKINSREVIIEAKIIEIDLKNNILMVSGIDKASINQIGDKCVISCDGVKLFGEAGEDIDQNDFRVDDIVSIMCDGVVQESYPTKIVNVEWVQINNEE